VKWLARLLGLTLVIGGVVAVAGVHAFHAWLVRPLPIAEAQTIDVLPGDTLRGLSHRLAADGVLDDPWFFVIEGRMSDRSSRLKAGEYRVTPATTPLALLDDMVAGRVVTYDVTIPEGWTAMQAVEALRRAPKLDDDLADVDAEHLLERLQRGRGPVEGLFFPDTYVYRKGDSATSILASAYDRMTQVLNDAWHGRDAGLPYRAPYDALILASIVEKETGRADDRDLIGRVFVSRLERNMRLQSDPTVIYGLGAAFDGNLRRIDLDTDGPYNTYTRSGLPPTPIALPGLASIRAALHPAAGDYLYFVARGDGSSEFSRTLDEHNRAVRKYQLNGGRK
jgi:UPF0755 protein